MSIGARLSNMGMRATRLIFGPRKPPLKIFATNFDTLSDFVGWFITPPGPEYETDQALVPEGHRAWILKARALDNETPDAASYKPHRGYPTVQMYKRSGAFKSPCVVSLLLKVTLPLRSRGPGKVDDWFSPATFTGDTSDSWQPTLTVTLGPDGYLRWMHVPATGQAVYLYQADAVNDPQGLLKFPQGLLVRLDMVIDTAPGTGIVSLYQDRELVSMAALANGNGLIAQAHFGLYASAAVAGGEVINRKLRIVEVRTYAEAQALITSAF